eukprot:1195563-Prorocentrum_minimum.AAC.3
MTDNHPRQFVIVSGSLLYYMRTLHKSFRQGWFDSLNHSITTFEAAIATLQADALDDNSPRGVSANASLGYGGPERKTTPRPEQVLLNHNTKEEEQVSNDAHPVVSLHLTTNPLPTFVA